MKQIIVVFTVAALLPLMGADDNAWSGTWKLNTKKSKFSPGPPPKSGTLVIEVQGDSIKTNFEEIEADDSHVGYAYTAPLDGKDYPLTGSRLDLLGGADSVALRRDGSRAYGGMFKKAGLLVMTNNTTVSRDGKTLTLTVGGVDAKGEQVKLLTLWDKQSP